MRLALIIPCVIVAAIAPPDCDLFSDDGDWERFNHEEDAVVVEVTAQAVLGDDVVVELRSTTGAVVVGTVTVSPGSGPVGTSHDVLVQINDDYVGRVDRVSLDAVSISRGVETVELAQDSAELGLWFSDVTSYGAEGEVRSDTFLLGLFEDASTSNDASEAGDRR